MDRLQQRIADPVALFDAIETGLILQHLSGREEGSKTISWGTMPMARLALRRCVSMSKPQMLTVPLVFITSPASVLISVDLPAPLGPSRPKIWPWGTSKLTPLSASLPSPFPAGA
jgi:hypothetical protein